MLYRLGDNWRLLAGVHKGFNPPAPGTSASEETSLNVEAGARFNRGHFSLDSIIFINDYDNLVGTVTESTGGGEIGDQFDGGKVLVTGLELSTAYAWTFGKLEIPLSVDYTWTAKAEFRNAFDSGFDPWGSVAVGDELPYIPEHQFRVAGGLHANDLRIDVAASYVGEMRTRAAQGELVQSESIGSRLVWDFVASWKFSERFASYIKVDNLLDKTYVAARRPAGARPGLPRSAYLGITYWL
jgi:Fe(3+) dicitrate transport protein